MSINVPVNRSVNRSSFYFDYATVGGLEIQSSAILPTPRRSASPPLCQAIQSKGVQVLGQHNPRLSSSHHLVVGHGLFFHDSPLDEVSAVRQAPKLPVAISVFDDDGSFRRSEFRRCGFLCAVPGPGDRGSGGGTVMLPSTRSSAFASAKTAISFLRYINVALLQLAMKDRYGTKLDLCSLQADLHQQ